MRLREEKLTGYILRFEENEKNKASGPGGVITEIIQERNEEILDLLKCLFLTNA